MTVGNYNLNQIWLQLDKYQAHLHTLLAVLLAVYLIAYAADLTWRLLPQPDISAAQPIQIDNNPAARQSGPQKVDLSKIKRLNLFGDLSAQPEAVQEVEEAPQTRLNLTLSGVVSSPDPQVASAIIENKGTQSTYGIDDKIDDTNAVLKQVFADRVIIRNGARRETLMLEGLDYEQANQTTQATSNSRRAPRTERTQLDQAALRETANLRQRPAEFSDYIAISPYREDGQLAGYRVSPGKRPALFRAVGFKAGDLVVDVNGLDLTDPQQSLEAMNALRESQLLQLTVNRQGEMVTLYLDIPAGEQEL